MKKYLKVFVVMMLFAVIPIVWAISDDKKVCQVIGEVHFTEVDLDQFASKLDYQIGAIESKGRVAK